MQQSSKPSVRFISLGCPKNLVDSEVMAGLLQKEHFNLVASNQPSDVIVVNTCGFIEDSKKESINTILEMAEEKKAGRARVLLVAGCLSQRYANELPGLLPEVDAFMGTADFSRLSEIIQKKLNGEESRNFIAQPHETAHWDTPRFNSTPSFSRFVKLSEGCSHRCSFCTIPMMRGGLKSRPSDDVLKEITTGITDGVREFNLIAQDLNEYGRDLAPRDSLITLLSKLANFSGDIWVRLLYMYPLQFPDKLIQLMSCHPHVCPYVDIPLQHIDDRILTSMRRGSSSRYIYRLIHQLRSTIPGIILRTTLIAGYPGETEREFSRLVDFVREVEFDRLGVFTYSDEEGTAAVNLPQKITERLKRERRDVLMKTQQAISLKKNRAYIGKTLKVLVESMEDTSGVLHGTGRFFGQAPNIDGHVTLSTIKDGEWGPASLIGRFVQTRITGASEYDLMGEIIHAAA